MSKETVIIIRTNDGVISQTIIPESGKPLLIKAQAGVTYELKDVASNVAPDQVLLSRDGNNLKIHITPKHKKGKDDENAEVIIEGYYDGAEGDLIGLAEDGQYYNYVPQEGSESLLVSEMDSGATSYSSLGAMDTDSFSMLPVTLGLLALGAGVAAAGGGGSSPTPAVTLDTEPSNNFGKVILDGNPTQGSTLEAMVTDPDGVVGEPVYSWTIDGMEIPNSNQRSLILAQEYVGKEIFVTATYTDTFGQSIVKSTSVIVVDTIVPGQPTVSVPEAADGINFAEASDGVTVEVTLPSDAVEGDVITVSVDGSTPVGHTVTQVEIDAGTPVIVILPKTAIDAAGQGAATITTTYADPSGNAITPITINVMIDTVIPADPTTTPMSYEDNVGAIVNTASIAPATDDTQPGVNVGIDLTDVPNLYIDGHLVESDYDSVRGTLTPSVPLVDGVTYDLTYTLTDAVGNESGESPVLTITIDTTPPDYTDIDSIGLTDDVVPVIGPILDGAITNDSRPTYAGTIVSGADVVSVKIYDSGTQIGTTSVASDAWTFTPASDLSDGVHNFTVAAVDAAGNEGPQTALANDGTDTFTVDTSIVVAPVIATLSDNVGTLVGKFTTGVITDDETPVINGTTTAGTVVNVYDNGALLGTATVTGTAWSFEMSDLLDASNHTITATATNAAGTVSGFSSPFAFLIDTTAPGEGGSAGMPVINGVDDSVDPIIGNVANGGFTNDTTPTLSGTAEAGSIIKVYDDVIFLGQTTASGTGAWSYVASGSNGTTYNYHVTATDQAGNVSANSNDYTITVDTDKLSNIPSALAIQSIVDDQGSVQGPINISDAIPDTTDDSKPDLSGIAESGSTVTIYDNGTSIGTAIATDGNWIFTPTTPLITGNHSFTITATDAAGNISDVSTPAIDLEVISSGAPAAPVIVNVIDNVGTVSGNIAKDTGITNDTQPEIRGTAEADAMITIYADGNLPANIVATVTADGLGNWGIETSALTPGIHAITATATNAAGNTSVPTGLYNFTVDTSAIAPTFNLLDNSNNVIGAGTDDPTPTLVGAAGSAEAGATVTAYDDPDGAGGNDAVIIGTTIAATDGSWSITPTDSLVNGPHSIAATQTDVAGNTSLLSSTSSFALITNLAVPVINTLSDNVDPVQGTFSSGVNTNDTNPTLNGTAPAGAEVTIYEGGAVLGTVTADSSGVWNLELFAALSEGLHILTATATVLLAVESATSGAFYLTVDTLAPSGLGLPVITSIEDDVGAIQLSVTSGGVTDDITPTLKGTAEADSVIHVYDDVGGLLGSTATDASGAWTFTPATALDDLTHTFHVTATDTAGNVSADSTDYIITIDVTPPTLTVVAPDAVYDVSPTITGTSDAADGTAVSVVVTQGAAIQTLNTTVVGGNYSVDIATDLIEGAYTVAASISDAAGNPNTATDGGSVNVNTAPTAMDDSNLVANDAPMSIYSGLFRFYDTMLGREPDMDGYNYYVTHLINGTLTPAQVAQGFLDSNDGDFAAMSDTVFVTQLVTNAYGRVPMPAEQADFETQLASMGRVDFSMMISESPESILVHSEPFYAFAVANTLATEVFVSAEDNNVTIPVGRLLANDTDADGDTLIVTSVQDSFGGTASLVAGVITFIPTLNYSGPASFTYTVDDGHGGVDTATFLWTITAVNDAPIIVFSDMNGSVDGQITVDERAMPSGNNSVSTAESAIGTFTIFDVEGLASITVGGVVITASSATQYVVANGYMTIDSFNVYTGVVEYTYTLTAPTSGNSAVIPIEIIVTDSDGMNTTGILNVRVLDDVPTISSSTLTFVPSPINTNLMVTLDLSASMNNAPDGSTPNVSGEASNLELAKQALFNLISKYDTLGDVKVMLVIFSDTTDSLSAWVTADEAKQIMATLEAPGSATNYNIALSEAMSAFGNSGKLTDNVQNVSYFLSDGVPNQGGNANYATDTGSTWTNFLSSNDILSHAIGINAAAMNNIAFDGITDTNINATQISSLSDLDSTLAATVPLLPLVGNVSGSFSSTYGADGGYVKEFIADGVTYTYDPTGNGGAGSVMRSIDNGLYYHWDDVSNTIVFLTSHGSSVSVNMNSGQASFSAPTTVAVAYSETYTYTTTDMDGDTASSSTTVNVPVTATPIEVNLIGGVGAQTLTGGSSNDFLQGSSGNDILIGGGGNDILIGGGGSDTLTGGTGQDIFIFSPINTSSNGGIATDTITDFFTDKDGIFETNEDVIDLSGFFSNQGINVNAGNVGDYLHMSGTNIQIDYNGPSFWFGSSWTTIATLSGTSTIFTDADLSNMIAANQIVL